MHRYLLHNGKIHDAGEKLLTAGQVGLLNGWGVFSTLQVRGGALFAFNRHWARMNRDAALVHVPMPPDPDEIHSQLLELVQVNAAFDATLRVVIVRNRGGMWEGPNLARDWDVLAFTTDLKDWGNSLRLAVAPQARHSGCRFAGAKILAWAANLALLEEAQTRGYDEVILLNDKQQVSECTSANIFVASGDRVWTPPLSSGCLPGVTRELLLRDVSVPDISIGERELTLKDLEQADAVFVTSSTRNLLPVAEIEGLEVRQSETVYRRLWQAFQDYLEDYIRKADKRAPGAPKDL